MIDKYHYDCPIEAAYMFKTHDIPLIYFVGKRLYPVIAWEDMFPYGELKYYVHPNSTGLEPQVGDLISINNGESANIATHSEFLEQLKVMKHQFVVPVVIIQRNNKPFIMPKQEKIKLEIK